MNTVSPDSPQLQDLQNQLALCKMRIKHTITPEGKWLLRGQKEKIKTQMQQILNASQVAARAQGNEEALSKSITTTTHPESGALQHLLHWVDAYLRASADSKIQN